MGSELTSTDIIFNFISTKIGYGNPYGKYWFIGPEEGGSVVSLIERINVWNDLDRYASFQDMKEFHLKFKNGTERFFEEKLILQRTWGGLIELLFGIIGEDNFVSSKKNYQSQKLGTRNGDTLLGELFPFSSKSLIDKEWLHVMTTPKKDYWKNLLEVRINLLTHAIIQHNPKVVLFYSTSFREHWEKIIFQTDGKKINTPNTSLPVTVYKSAFTTFAIIPHPVSIQMNGVKKYQIGQYIASIIESHNIQN